jgi:hypothetical protein
MRCAVRANERSRKSNVGAIGLCVPPRSRTVDGPSAAQSAGRIVCSTRVVLPAVPIANS